MLAKWLEDLDTSPLKLLADPRITANEMEAKIERRLTAALKHATEVLYAEVHNGSSWSKPRQYRDRAYFKLLSTPVPTNT